MKHRQQTNKVELQAEILDLGEGLTAIGIDFMQYHSRLQ